MTVAAASLITGTNHAAFQISKDVWNAHDHTFGSGTSSLPGVAFTSELTLGLWRIGTGNAGFSGSLAIKGPRPWADAMGYGTGSLTATEVQAALNALTAGGICLMPGVVTLGATSLTWPAVDGIELRGVGNDAGTGTTVGTILTYSGTGTAIVVGTGAADRWYAKLKDFKLVGTSAGAIGIDMNRTFHGVIEDVLVRDFTTGVGIELNGTTSFGAYNRLVGARTSNCLKGLYILGVDGGSEFGSNATTIAGGSFNCGNLAASTACHYAGGTVKEIGGTEHCNATVGVKLSGTSIHVLNAPRFEDTTTAILIDADVTAPFIEGVTYGGGITTPVTNNGKGLVYIPAEGDRGEIRQSALAVPASRFYDFVDYQNELGGSLFKIDSDGKPIINNPLDGSADLYLQAGSTAEQARTIHFRTRAAVDVWTINVGVVAATTGFTVSQSGVRTWINCNANNGILALDASTSVAITAPVLSVGSTPATAGTIRIPNAGTIQGRDAGNANNRQMLAFTSGDVVTLGVSTVATQIAGSAIGFFGVTPAARASAYTQTYATATKTHSNPTATTLTDSSGGTANTTVQALTDPVDAPATADALRDDLVANLIPQLRNNYADLTAAVNALIVDVANAKQVLNSVIDDDQTYGLRQ